MDDLFIAELLVAGPSPDHRRALAEQARGWFGERTLRCLGTEVRAADQPGLYVLTGRFAVAPPPPDRLTRAVSWLGLVDGSGRSRGARR